MRVARALAPTILAVILTAPAAQAAVPGATTRQAVNVTQTSARLQGTVDPNNEPTTWYFEYGTSTGYGTRIPDQGPLNGATGQQVAFDVGGLAPGTTYHFRIVASNASGVRAGRDREFTTPAAVSLAASANPVIFGQPMTLSGGLTGGTIAGVQVALEENLYPFTGFAEVATAITDVNGRFTFVRTPVANAAYRVTAADRPAARSPTILALVRSRVSMRVSTSRPRQGRPVRFSGSVSPAHTGHTVYIQRLTSRGWRTAVRARLVATANPFVVSYSATLRRVRSGRYRAFVPMKLAHLAGNSSSRRVSVRR